MWWAKASFGIVLAMTSVWAQENAPAGFLKGDFLSWTGTPRSGQFVFQSAGNRIYSCTYDDKTYIERDKRYVTIAGAEKGDRLEIVSDYRNNSTVCYARLVHILDPQRAHVVPGVRSRATASNRPFEVFGPRGNMTLSGLVMGVGTNVLTLKSRRGEYQTIHLRADTRYSDEGQTAEAGNLRVNTLVFIRCSRNLENEVEAYQVVWGEILRPEE
jgi:hypothetical protein